jgi:hypothetical protein
VTTNPPPVLIKRARLLAALEISSETLRRWLASGKCPPPDVDVGTGQQWWHPETLARAGIRLQPADQAAANPPRPASS